MDSTNSNLLQTSSKCDGNICINKTESVEFIILEKVLYIELCDDCQRIAGLGQQIRILTDSIELVDFFNPFKKWEDLTQFEFNHVYIFKVLKSILNRLSEIYDLISSTWYGLEALETAIENIITNIHFIQNLKTDKTPINTQPLKATQSYHG